MSEFWGYPNADILAVIIIGTCSAVCLYCARRFVSRYH
jgi:L-lysine 2,3-aminomutase